jgi:hypothetical protein
MKSNALPAAAPAFSSSADLPDERSLEETRRALADAAHRRFGSIPESVISDHVVAFTEGADFAVRSAALDALLRRRGFALRDSLRVTAV